MVKIFCRVARGFFLCFMLAVMCTAAFAAKSQDSGPRENAILEGVRGVFLRSLTPNEIVSADQVRKSQEKKEKFLIFDARSKDAYEAAHMEGAILPLSEDYYLQRRLYAQQLVPVPPDPDQYLIEAMLKYPRSTVFVTYCEVDCRASANLLLKIKKLGFSDVKSMEEGFNAWQKKGYPVVLGVPHLALDTFPGGNNRAAARQANKV